MNSRHAFRADDERPPGALLITSPGRLSKHATVARGARPGPGIRFTSTSMCEDDEPHFIVEVVSTDATTVDGSVLQEIHEHEAAHDLLPHQHLMDMGYVDAEVLAETQMRYHVDVVGPVMPDTCLRIQRSWTV